MPLGAWRTDPSGTGHFGYRGYSVERHRQRFLHQYEKGQRFFFSFFFLSFFFTRLQRFPVITTTVSGCFSDTQLSDTFSASVRERPTFFFIFIFLFFSFSWLQRFPMITNENGQRLFFLMCSRIVFCISTRTANCYFSDTHLRRFLQDYENSQHFFFFYAASNRLLLNLHHYENGQRFFFFFLDESFSAKSPSLRERSTVLLLLLLS